MVQLKTMLITSLLGLASLASASFENQIQRFDANNNLLSIQTSTTAATMPLALVMVLDISGSMGGAAKENGGSDGQAFSRLDLVKHGVNTVTKLLPDDSILGIMTFSDDVKTVVPSTKLNDVLKQRITQTVMGLQPQASTNLWQAILQGYGEAKRIRDQYPLYNVNVVVLTDGEPTIGEPSEPYRAALPRKLEAPRPGVSPISLNVIGMSNAPNPDLLSTVARIGNGTFSYICDGSMVGAVFQHLVSNMLNTAANNYWYGDLFVGKLAKEQVRHLLVPNTIPLTSTAPVKQPVRDYISLVQMLEALVSARNGQAAARSIIDSYHFESEAILDDLEHPDHDKGQIGKAIESLESWRTWGKTYLAAIRFSHSRQEAGNYFDASMNAYVSSSLAVLRDNARAVFETIPEPKPSRQAYVTSYSGGNYVAPSLAAVSNGGCFGGDSIIDTAAGPKRMDAIVPGEVLKNGAKVKYVIKFHEASDLYPLGNGSATAWHPFRRQGEEKWQFPAEAVAKSQDKVSVVYNLILDAKHTLSMGDVEFVTLGHDIKEPIADHAYFGDMDKIMRDFGGKGINGVIDAKEVKVLRGADGLISGYEFK